MQLEFEFLSSGAKIPRINQQGTRGWPKRSPPLLLDPCPFFLPICTGHGDRHTSAKDTCRAERPLVSSRGIFMNQASDSSRKYSSIVNDGPSRAAARSM